MARNVLVLSLLVCCFFMVSMNTMVYSGPMDNANEFMQQAIEENSGDPMDQESAGDSGEISWGDDIKDSTNDQTTEQSFEQPDPTAADNE